MGFDPRHAEHEIIAATLERDGSRMDARQIASTVVAGAGFVAAQVALLVAWAPGRLHLVPVLLSLLVMVVAQQVRIDTPFGFTSAVQLGFVPLCFVAPPSLVPVLACLALLLADLVSVLRGELRAARLLTAPANSWYALGPALVLCLHGGPAAGASLVVLVLALLAQFLLDFGVSSLRQHAERQVSLRDQLGDTWIYGVDAAFSWVAATVAGGAGNATVGVLAFLPLLALLRFFAGERRKRLESTLELSAAYRGTALVLGDVVEADDGYTGEHCRGVVALALALGEELHVGADRQRNLEFGALLHDVGKVAIPKAIINKPGRLDPDEWVIVKTHTVEGQRMLDRVGGFMREVGLIVRSHHERWDGGGYPDGLAGEAIPLEARIISACDTWNAMRTDRSYRKALSHEPAMAELLASSGTQLDPDVVAGLVRVIERDRRSTHGQSAPPNEAHPAGESPAPPAALRTTGKGRPAVPVG